MGMSTTERELRRMLWERHGCPFSALYADDGEMSCGSCLTDFGRMTPDEIAKMLARHQERIREARGKLALGPERIKMISFTIQLSDGHRVIESFVRQEKIAGLLSDNQPIGGFLCSLADTAKNPSGGSEEAAGSS